MTWPTARLEDCTTIVAGATPSTSVPGYWDGDIWWATPKDLSDLDDIYIDRTPRTITTSGLESCAAEILPVGSVLFSSRAPIGHVAINRVPVATNQGFKSFIPHKKLLEANYLLRWLKANRSYLEGLGNGATFKELSKAAVGRVEIPLPPLAEQKRIAAVLDQADEVRRKRFATVAYLNKLLDSTFVATCGIDTPYLTIEEALDREFLLVHKDGNHGSLYPRADDFGEVGVPFVSAKSIAQNGQIDDTLTERLSEVKAKILRHGWLHAGDVLLAHNATVGKVGLYKGQYDRAIVGTSLTVFRCNPRKLTPEFLFAALRSSDFQQQLAKNMGQTTRNQVPITAQRSLRLPMPDLASQATFSAKADAISTLGNGFALHLIKLDELFVSLQHRAFHGELTSKQAERELEMAS